MPSDHLRPSLKWNVHVRPSSDVSHDSACPSFNWPFSSRVRRPSNAWRIMLPPSTALFSAGSTVSGSGPTWTFRIFSPVVLPASVDSAVVWLLSLAAVVSFAAELPQPARPATIAAVSRRGKILFFMFSSPFLFCRCSEPTAWTMVPNNLRFL